MAILNQNIEIIKLLLSNKNINVNIINKFTSEEGYSEETALIKAIDRENNEIIRLLLAQKNIDVNFLNKYCIEGKELKVNALYYAILDEKIEIIKLLLSHKDINANIKNKEVLEDMKPIITVSKKNYEIIRLLLNNKGIDINIKNEDGKKPTDLTNDKRMIEMIQSSNHRIKLGDSSKTHPIKNIKHENLIKSCNKSKNESLESSKKIQFKKVRKPANNIKFQDLTTETIEQLMVQSSFIGNGATSNEGLLCLKILKKEVFKSTKNENKNKKNNMDR